MSFYDDTRYSRDKGPIHHASFQCEVVQSQYNLLNLDPASYENPRLPCISLFKNVRLPLNMSFDINFKIYPLPCRQEFNKMVRIVIIVKIDCLSVLAEVWTVNDRDDSVSDGIKQMAPLNNHLNKVTCCAAERQSIPLLYNIELI